MNIEEDQDLKKELDFLNEIITVNLNPHDPTDSNLDRCYREFSFLGPPEQVLDTAPTKAPRLVVLWEDILKELEQFEPDLRKEIAQKHDSSQAHLYDRKHMQEIARLACSVMKIRIARNDIGEILENLKKSNSYDQSFGVLGSCTIREALTDLFSSLSSHGLSFDIQKLRALNEEIRELVKDMENWDF